MREKSLARDLTTGNIAVLMLSFIGPLFISNVLQTVYNVVDMAVVGHFIGDLGLSAVSVCGDVMSVLTFIAIGFSNAGHALVAQYTGAGRPDKTNAIIGSLFTALLTVSLVFTALSLVFHDAILSFANIPDASRAYGRDYFMTMCAGLVFSYGYNVVSAILRGMGDSKHPFVFIAIASVLNIVLDIVFVAVLDLGTFGAAFATVISQAVSFITAIVFLYRNRERFGFDFRPSSFRVTRETLEPLVKLGIPMALQVGLIQFSKLIAARWINAYGVTASAISGIGNKFNSICLVFSQAVGAAASAMIGQCIGAKKYDRVTKAMCVSGALAIGIASVLSLVVGLFPKAVFSIFTDDAALLEMSVEYVPVVILIVLSGAVRTPMNGLVNGAGRPRVNFLFAVFDGVVGRIGLTALLGFGFGLGLKGLWYGNALAGFLPFFVGLVFYLNGGWKKGKNWAEK